MSDSAPLSLSSTAWRAAAPRSAALIRTTTTLQLAAIAAAIALANTSPAAATNCGNSLLDPGEACDDGNGADGDGCSGTCQIEAGFECTLPEPPAAGRNIVADPSFEAGTPNPFWDESSSNFGTPLCTVALCGGPGGTDGDWFARFGGAGDFEQGRLAQTLTIPVTASALEFDLWFALCETAMDFLGVTIDETLVFTTEPCLITGDYVRQSIDVTAFADGAPHLLALFSTTFALTGNPSRLYVDHLSLSDNVPVSPVPSTCTALPPLCHAADFDGESGDPGNWTRFNVGPLDVDWGATDDGLCLGPGGNVGAPGNYTGGTGEAACIDSDIAGNGGIDAYLCSPPLDLEATAAPELRFRYNYQLFGLAGPEDRLEVLAGEVPPDATTIESYATVFTVAENAGGFAALPGREAGAFGSISFPPTSSFLCFRYGADFDWYAQVDDVAVRANGCGGTDTDADGIPDDADNCITFTNIDQRDTDLDGIGNECDPDLNQDCSVAFLDLGLLKADFFPGYNPDADLNGDGLVNFLDLGRMKQLYFNQPEPGPGPSGIANLCDG